MSAIDEVKQRLDIVEVVGRYTQLTKAGRNFKAVCPFHSEKTPSFFVFPERQSWHCFGACNTGGDAFSFVMKKENMTFGEALQLLADRVGVTLPRKIEPDVQKDEKERYYQANEAASQFYHNLLVTSQAGEKTRAYLDGRGVNARTISDFQLGLSPNTWEALKLHLLERGFTEEEMLAVGLIVRSDDGRTHDRFRNRLMFPIREQRGRVTGFGGRQLDDTPPKYLNSPQTPVFDKSDTLYGIDLTAASIRRTDLAVITEGYMDVIVPHQYGFTNVVASMGVAITDKQVNKLKRLTKNLVLALDPDAAGEEAMLRCIDYEAILGSEIRVILLRGGKDPDELIKENADAWRELVEKAMPIVEFAITRATSRLDMSKARDKSSAANSLLPVIARVKDDIRRDHYLTVLSKQTGIGYNILEGVLKNQKAKPALTPKAKITTPAPTLRTAVSSSREEYCLALLLQYPDLKGLESDLVPEYFQNSENREIFNRLMETDDLMMLKETLDPMVRDKTDELLTKQILGKPSVDKLTSCVLELKKDYLRTQHNIRSETFALEVEGGGKGADINRLKQDGLEPNEKLQEVFLRKAQAKRKVRQ